MLVCTTQGMLACTLEEYGLTIQDGEGLLQACNLCFTTLDTVCVRLWFGNAPFLDALVILEDCVEFFLFTGPVSSGLCCCLVEALCFLGLVLHILLFGCLGDLVLLGFLLIGAGSGLLCGGHLSETLGEI